MIADYDKGLYRLRVIVFNIWIYTTTRYTKYIK